LVAGFVGHGWARGKRLRTRVKGLLKR
jgi:hypothetical protein